MNRNQFKFLSKYTYLDSAAGTLKPQVVIDEIVNFYHNFPINPHSSDSKPGIKVGSLIKEARNNIAKLLKCEADEVIFTSGVTDSLNRFAIMIASEIKEGDEIILSYGNHSSAIVPFIEMAKKQKAKVILSERIIPKINKRTKLIVVAQENNSIPYPEKWVDIVGAAKKNNILLVNDAAQAIMHQEVSLNEADVVVFSGNKIYGPTGTGVLAIKKELLSSLKPATFGGGATAKIDFDGISWKGRGTIGDYEAGTPNTAGIIGLNAAVKFFLGEIKSGAWEHEQKVTKYAFDCLSNLKEITLYPTRGSHNLFFNVNNVNAHDVVSALGHRGIILRSGSHCAYLTSKLIDVPSTIRLSIGAYNNEEDVDKLIKELKKGDYFDFL